MTRVRVLQVITRHVLGGARAVVEQLRRGLSPDEFEQELVCGPEGAPPDATVVPALVREVRPAQDLAALLALAQLFARRRPDVVHAHTYKAGILSCVAGRLAGVRRVIFTPHGHIFGEGARIPGVPGGGWKRQLLRWVTRAGQACADRITALSEEDLGQQLALGLASASKYEVVPNGIDTERFESVARVRRFEGRPVVGAVGRFTPEKGHAVLVEAFSILRRSHAGARLVLVGEGPEEEALRRCTAPLREAVTFTGAVDSAELLGSFDVFAQPSHYESQGLAILEAQAAGIPVAATAVGGVPAVVRHGETGLLVPPSDPAALAAALDRLVSDPGAAGRMAAAAREQVRVRHSRGAMLAAYRRLYEG